MKELREKGFVDDKAIHSLSVSQDETKVQIETEQANMAPEVCQDEYSNNINNTISNMAHCAQGTIRCAIKEIPFNMLNQIVYSDGDNWKNHTQNNIWTNPSGEQFRIVYDK